MWLKKYRRWKRIDRWLQTAIVAISIIICADLLSGQNITSLILGILRIDNNVTITSGQILLPNGTAPLPSFAFSGDPTYGFWKRDAASVGFSIAGIDRHAFNAVGWYILNDSANLYFGALADLVITRDAANTLAIKNGNNDQTQRWYGSNSSYFQIQSVSEYLTINAAVSTDTAMSIPANAVVRGVAVYVAVTIPTAATLTVTGATSGTAFNTAAVGTALGSNDVGTQNTPYKNGAAQLIRITPNLAPANNNGRVRVVLFYEIPSPPTS